MPRTLAPLVGALTLVVGYAVAQASGNRTMGGAVLLIGGACCVGAWWRNPGPARALVAVAVFAAAFAVSHPLGKHIGAWPSVLLVAAGAAAITWSIGRRTAPAEVASQYR